MRSFLYFLNFLFLLGTVAVKASLPLPDEQKQALIDLYQATDGANWKSNNNWLIDEDACNWEWVSCSNSLFDNGMHQMSIISISMGSNNLTGSIPSSLGNLPHLKTLNLSNNNLTGSIPDSLGNLSSLDALFLLRNQLTGSIPSTIGNLTNLYWLSLTHNQITGNIPSSIGNLTKLEKLDLDFNQITGVPKSIENAKNLRSVSITRNKLTEGTLDAFSNSTSIAFLTLAGNQLTGSIPSNIDNMSSLSYLNLVDNKLTGKIPDSIGNLTSLSYLNLSDNKLTGKIPDSIGNLTYLNGLNLSKNQLTGEIPDSFENSTRLTELKLNSNQLIGSTPESIFSHFDTLYSQPDRPYISFDLDSGVGGPLPDDFLNKYPAIAGQIVSNFRFIRAFGDGNCYPDVLGFSGPLSGTDWLSSSCSTEENACPEDNTGPECIVGNPINLRTGVKQESATDYAAVGQSLLKIKRNYNSDKRLWNFNTFEQSLIVSGSYVKVKGRNKSNYLFTCSTSGSLPSSCSSRKLIGQVTTYYGYELTKLKTGYLLVLPSGATEEYDTNGKLIKTSSANGQSLAFTYVEGTGTKTVTMTDEYNQQIVLTTNSDNQVIQAITPIGTFTYSYDEFDRLISVTKPDNSTIGYKYDEAEYAIVEYYDNNAIDPIVNCNGDDYLTIDVCKNTVKKLGLLTGKIDEKGQLVASWYYDDKQRAYKSEHGSGIDTTEIKFVSEQGQVQQNEQGEAVTLQRVRDSISPLGLRTRTTFRSPYAQRAEKVEVFDKIDTLISTQTYHYDNNGYEKEHLDVNGLKTTYVRDSTGREISRIENAGTESARTITTSYSGDTNKPSVITTPETRINISYINYNTGLLASEQEITDLSTNEQRTTTFSYNNLGQLISTNGPRTDVNDVTRYEYNAQGLKTKTTNALSQITEITAFSALGKPTQIVDENNSVTDLSYDVMGRLISIQRAGTTQSFEYDLTGALIKSTSVNGTVIEYEYDVATRLTAIQDSLGNRIEYSLDAAGNQLSTTIKDVSGTLLQTKQQLFDEFNRLVKITNGTNNNTVLNYLHNGNLANSVDALNNQTSNRYDNLQQLVSIHDAQGGQTQFTYDNAGRTTQITDATGKATSYTYNGFGELIKQVSPDTGETNFTYDKAGNLLTETDARGIVVSFQYDALNRVTSSHYSDPNNVPVDAPDSVNNLKPSLVSAAASSTPIQNENKAFGYDDTVNGNHGIGRITSVNESAGNRSFTYNAQGALLNEAYAIAQQNYNLAYQYDDSGQLIGITYPSGRQITFVLNSLGQINAINTLAAGKNQSSQSVVSNVSYLPFGPLNGFTFSNGLESSYQYDKNYRLTTHTLTGLKNEILSYTDIGNISAISDAINSNNSTFNYDKLSRLISANKTKQNLNDDFVFSYDEIGNRQSKATNNTIENYSYINNTHHLESVSINKKVQAPSYTSTFNQARRMASVTSHGVTTQYHYNHRELRVSKTQNINDVIEGIHYHYDSNGLLIAESDINGNWLKEYMYLNGQLVAMFDYVDGIASAIYAIHTDHLGTPNQITNLQGKSVWQAHYSPFGLATINTEDVSSSGSSTLVELNIRFPGQYYDVETGLHYNWHRYYDPKIGRYITSDPLGLAAGMNTYGYVGGNPVNYFDPDGLETYQCIRPLQKKAGENLRNGPDLWGNPAYHQYSCIELDDGTFICDGQTGSSNSAVKNILQSPGKSSGWLSGELTEDKYDIQACEQVRDQDMCYESCIIEEWTNDRPIYGIGPQGTDCQEYDDEIHKKCKKKCPVTFE